MKKTFALFILLASFTLVSHARSVDPKTAYRNVADISLPSLKVPTVVEIPSSNLGYQVGVFDHTTSEFVPSLVRSGINELLPKSITSTSQSSEAGGVDTSGFKAIYDKNYNTFFEFPINENGRGAIVFSVNFNTALKTNSLTFSLSEFVALPKRVSIYSKLGNVYKPVLIDYVPTSSVVNFPEYTSDSFEVRLEYSQPLRINEIKFNQVNAPATTETLRFLALPDHVYKVFSNPAYVVSLNLPESADLQDDRDVLKVSKVFASVANQLFAEPDTDDDTVIDVQDNCVQTANTDQKDEDGNGRGDVCDDFDRDNIINSIDNCPESPNRNQIDTDRDGKGDVCDGQESRLTEKYPVLVWGAIIFAALIFSSLLYFVVRKAKEVPNQGV